MSKNGSNGNRLHSRAKPAIVAFAKNPEVEPVKTRLAASLGPETACKLYTSLLADCLHSLSNLKQMRRFISCSSSSRHPYFLNLASKYGVELVEQTGENLGERMLSCIEELSLNFEPVVIVGTDVPILPIDELCLALTDPKPWDVLLGPTLDGGYYLIAMNKPHAEVFAQVDWSTEKVLHQTRQNCAHHQLKLRELPPSLDVDDVGSLLHLSHILQKNPDCAVHTRRVLNDLGLNFD